MPQPHNWTEPLPYEAEPATEPDRAGNHAPHRRPVTLYLIVCFLLLMAGVVLLIL